MVTFQFYEIVVVNNFVQFCTSLLWRGISLTLLHATIIESNLQTDIFLRRERERERETDMREKHRLVAFSYAPRLGIALTTWVFALTRNQTHGLSVWEDIVTK